MGRYQNVLVPALPLDKAHMEALRNFLTVDIGDENEREDFAVFLYERWNPAHDEDGLAVYDDLIAAMQPRAVFERLLGLMRSEV